MQKGFTLIELMIVVAIIGILAVLATASFLSFQSKSKQAEATVNLGAIGKLAQSYYAEYDTYVTGFNGLGWAPNLTTRYGYWYNGEQMPGTPSAPEVGVSYADPGSTATSVSFTTAAVGNIDRDVSTDQWTFTDIRVLTNTQSDVVTP
jgi:prepilin-type N-terminal cleavage/methylation domain-containing protein